MRQPKKGGDGPKNVAGPNIRLARLSSNPPLTQDQLSGQLATKQVFIDRVAITKIENGQRCIFDFEIGIFAEILKVDVRWLLGLQANGGPPKQGRRSK